MNPEEIKKELIRIIERFTEAPDLKHNTPETILAYCILDLKFLRDKI